MNVARSTSCRHFRRFLCTKAPAEEVPKKSIARRIVNHFKNILEDYRTVAKETWQDMKERPIKSTFYISLISGAVVLLKTNPGEKEFHNRLTENSIDLMLVGEPIRNSYSALNIAHLAKESSESRLKFYNLGLFSLICGRAYGPQLGLYEANCKYVKPHWTEFHKTILDVGLLGRWRYLEKYMVNFDIQAEEWQSDGQPNMQYDGFIARNKNLISWDMKMK